MSKQKTIFIIVIVTVVVCVIGGGLLLLWNYYRNNKKDNNNELVQTSSQDMALNTTDYNSTSNSTTKQSKDAYNGDEGPLAYSITSKSSSVSLRDGSLQNISGNFNVYQYNIETGTKKDVFSFLNNSKGYATTIDIDTPYIPCWQLKEIFSYDMSKLAVSWFDNSDGSHRVGWVDKNGNLTDITNIIHPTTSDFSSQVPYDTAAVFSPEGYFVFSDHNKEKYVYVDLDSKSVVKENDVMTKPSLDVNNPTRIWNVLFLPDGSITEILDVDNISSYDMVDFGEYKTQVAHTKKYDAGVTGYDLISNGVVIGIFREGVGNTLTIGKAVGKYGLGYTQQNRYNNYPYHGSYDYIFDFIRLTPQTEYNLERCVYHNGQIAFTGIRGSDRYLFVINDGTGEQNVRQIVRIPQGENLLFWR